MNNSAGVVLLWLAAVVVPAGLLYRDAGPERRALDVGKTGALALVSSERVGVTQGTHGSVYRWRIYDYAYGTKQYEVSERDPTPVEPDTKTEPVPFQQQLLRVDPKEPGYLVVVPAFGRGWWVAHLLKSLPLGLFIAVYAIMTGRAMRKKRDAGA